MTFAEVEILVADKIAEGAECIRVRLVNDGVPDGEARAVAERIARDSAQDCAAVLAQVRAELARPPA
jgi:enoyl-CoA hydratase/carnithine racemase